MTPPDPLFKADRNQVFAVVVMVAAVFSFASGEMLIGFILFGLAAVLSIGGLFWNAHSADKADAAAQGKSGAAANSEVSKD